MPWTLQYLRYRRKLAPWPAMGSLVAAPWAGMLTFMTSFLLITAAFDRLAMIPAATVTEEDPPPHPLAVLDLHADHTAGLTYFPARPAQAPSVHVALVARPLPPMPDQLDQLGYELAWVHGRKTPCQRRFFDLGQDADCWTLEPKKILTAKRYHRAPDWAGIRRALHQAQTAGIGSDVVLIEPDDGVRTDTLVHALDLCLDLGLRPVLKTR
jgi:hypothetical protein